MEQMATQWLVRFGPLGLFALQMFGIFGLPIPDETLMVLAGVMIRRGELSPALTVAAALAGAIVGISVSFGIGRLGGRAIASRSGLVRHVPQAALDRTERWFAGLGKWLLLVAYFIPGVRHVAAIVAGASGLSPRLFALFAYAGAALWVGCFLAIGYTLADEWRTILADLHRYASLFVVLGVAGVGAYLLWTWRRRGA
jgi:membrane protein DedA with SNARE-associated domain